ncbi:chromosome segregation protein SMC [Rheinheimera sp. MMS21-TC3]|uniref:chromosome segregation protein SMC n=1 Tax=Rheinheimera sp. MMS21-TC3 TaxID=3072790 RepID=UPI0028C4AD33|nr:chromosome segregation protein SMC [Rheinheimera sp. MMS21-TC3]WNO61351.1 chromosome segregation protein SMC [Rheinheimera sp. MMS21-TC3]
MRLKHIKLSGFKSFVDLTTVPFLQQMTAVVGPNGCGKSNVIDAVRWVLGESSAKNLRGDAMTDVIFNGSSHRKPVSLASVELLFENTQGYISGNLADRSEIAVKRTVSRDAQSTYYLNGTKCRRRDITDIFLGTGLGPRSYAIIEQGMISRLIESKPQELRVFIEEAAGISKYKERRRDTENRIKRTRENLERLSDVRDELGKNIEKLKRQATAAQRYKELKAQERKLKAELTSIKWLSYNSRLEQLEKQLSQQTTELEKYHAEQSGEQRQLLELKEQNLQARQKFDQFQARFYQLGSTISRLEQQILHQRQQQQQLNQQLQQAEQSLQQSSHFIAAEQEQYQEVTKQIEHDQPEIVILEAQLDELAQQLTVLEQQQQGQQQVYQQWQQQLFQLQKKQQQLELQLQNQQQQHQQLSQQQQQIEQEITQLAIAPLAQECRLQQHQLSSAEQNHQQQQALYTTTEQKVAQQVKQLEQIKSQLQQAQTRLQSLQLEQQRLSQRQQQQDTQQQQLLRQLEVKPGWALAVTMALGQLQHANAITTERLTQQQATQTSFVCATTDIEAATEADNRLSSVIISGVYPQSFDNIFLAKNAADAYALQASLSIDQSIISADGVWLGTNWGLYAGADQDNYLHISERLLAVKPELVAAEQDFKQADATKLEQQTALGLLQATQRQQQAQLTIAQQQIQQQKTALLLAEQALQYAENQQAKLISNKERLGLNLAMLVEQIAEQHIQLELCQEQLLSHQQQQDELISQQQNNQQQLMQHKAYFEQKRQQQQQLVLQCKMSQQQQQTLSLSIQRAKQQQQQLHEQVSEFKLKLQQDDEPELLLQEQLQQTLLELEQAEQSMHQQQEEVSGLDQQIRQLEQGQLSIEQLLQQKRVALETIRVEAEGFRVRANSMLEQLAQQNANLKQVLAELSAEADEESWQRQLDLTTDAIQRLGAINLAAIDEYEQQAERKHYLDAQNDDLEAAMTTLETAIRKIDKETRTKFKQTFEQVNEGLKSLFPKVFGGGSAYLTLTDDDLLETGVSIMARPPGKKNSTIHLLSGGEKALTALSLVFSIFQLNPAPFCMLDEVDAPLDDANVGRFCNLVREMSETVQFIYISHNKIAMEMATQLMGVTMQEPGVSRIVAVDVDDAVKMITAS